MHDMEHLNHLLTVRRTPQGKMALETADEGIWVATGCNLPGDPEGKKTLQYFCDLHDAALDDNNAPPKGYRLATDEERRLYPCNELPDKIQYDKGFNDAIDAIMLLDLELDLKGERKTWAEMADIVRKRWNVTPREISITEHEE